ISDIILATNKINFGNYEKLFWHFGFSNNHLLRKAFSADILNLDYTCYYLGITLIIVIEIKRAHILSDLKLGHSLPDYYETISSAKNVVQQIYYTMSENQLQTAILSTYMNHC